MKLLIHIKLNDGESVEFTVHSSAFYLGSEQIWDTTGFCFNLADIKELIIKPLSTANPS